MTTATLSAHVDSALTTRAALNALPMPVSLGPRHLPVRHIDLVEGLEMALNSQNLSITSEQLALRRDGQALFGVLKLTASTGEVRFPDGAPAIGFRASNDQGLAFRIVAGLSVFVCDNLVLRGDFIAFSRKHTTGLSLSTELTGAIDRLIYHFGQLLNETEALHQKAISDLQAKALICDAFSQRLMPSRLLPAVVQNYFEPPHLEFMPRTAWSLHNAFTQAAKAMPITTRMEATQGIGRLLRMQ